MRTFILSLISMAYAAAACAAAPLVASQPTVSFVAGQKTGAGYVTLENTSDAPVSITGITSDCCASVEMHEMRMDGDIMRMRQLDKLVVTPHRKAVFAPGENHLMFVDLKTQPKPGAVIAVTLQLAGGQTLPVKFVVDTKGN